jgi:membrane associated rhomboid family serine protease
MKHAVREELFGVFAFVGVVWCVFIVGQVLPLDIKAYGVTPRTLVGLAGIPAMPFLHASWGHLVSNTLPLTILLFLLAGSNANSWAVVVSIIIVGGALLWLFGRSATHIGASGLIYGLIAFLILSGILERRVVPLVIAILVGFLYGGTLVSGVIPGSATHVSWEGHLFGAIAGGIVAKLLTGSRNRTPWQVIGSRWQN